jgi:2-polyprenyl-3-methyl-5-hydroxy-6-metoxy-1,4-benzoquinol methylase
MTNSLYRDGRIYDAMNDAIIVDTHFYVNEFKDAPEEILELACGTGRITCELAKVGKQMTGLDLSESMLEVARSKSAMLGLNISWHLGDMTYFNLNKKFDLIFVGYNSVHHILTNHDFKNFMECVKKHLKPNGRLLFDIFNPSIAILNQRNIRTEMDDFFDPLTGEQIFVTEENVYDAATQVNHVTYFYSKKDQLEFHSHPLDMRCYFPQEMDALLDFGGFKVVNKYGSFKKDSFSASSIKQIFECALK